jgi:hypothetical protein
MKIRWLSALLLTALVPLGAAPARSSDAFHPDRFTARLRGSNETPAISTVAFGDFQAMISSDESEISFRLRYSGLEADTTMAHIHLGQANVGGGVIAFLCGGGSKPACPIGTGDITGTIVAADVVGPAGQGIAAGELAEVIKALRRGLVYANVHSMKFPSGEIRGQVGRFSFGDD